MLQLTKEELFLRIDYYDYLLRTKSLLFIHPTDTIYGIGCNAEDLEAVKKLRQLKKRAKRPFSVIAPSKEWIREHCEVTPLVEKWLEKLPGPYTLILRLKNKDIIAPDVNLGYDTLGVRIPDHWISEFVEKLGFPIVTTSANLSGEDSMTTIDDLNPQIKSHVDFIIYEGELRSRPSVLVHLEGEEKLIER